MVVPPVTRLLGDEIAVPPPSASGVGRRVLFSSEHARTMLLSLEDGASIPVHAPKTQLVLSVVEGTGELLVNGELLWLSAGDVATVPTGAPRGLRALGGRFVAVAMVTPPPDEADHDPTAGTDPWPSESGVDLAQLIHTEHQGLIRPIDQLQELAQELPQIEPSLLKERLTESVRFLRHDLLHHAAAEEEVIYPAVDRVLRSTGGATRSMMMDHSRIAEMTGELERLLEGPVSEDLRSSAQRLLFGLEALISNHLNKEEAIYLPQLGRLGANGQADLLAHLQGHGSGGPEVEV